MSNAVESRERFEREAKTISNLNHQTIQDERSRRPDSCSLRPVVDAQSRNPAELFHVVSDQSNVKTDRVGRDQQIE